MTKNRYKFGIELEMLCPENNLNEFNCLCENLGLITGIDGSIDSPSNFSGVEIKTQPLTYSQMIKIIPKISRLCDEKGIEVNQSCGFHLHTSNKRFFNYVILKRILMLWVSIEDVLFSTQPESRLNNHYCQRRLYDLAYRGSLPKLRRKKDDLINDADGLDRRYALNLQSLAKHGTLEVRLHSGTTNSKKMRYWIELIKSIYDYVLYNYNSKGVLKLFKMPSSEDKIKKVWELLKLRQPIRDHFNNRIFKFLLPKLAEQQRNAITILNNSPKLLKTKKRYEKIQGELRELDTLRTDLLQSFL